MNFARLLTWGTMNIRSTATIHPNLDLFIGGTIVNFDPRDHEVTFDKVEARFGELNLFTGHPVFGREFILNGGLIGGNDLVYIEEDLRWSTGGIHQNVVMNISGFLHLLSFHEKVLLNNATLIFRLVSIDNLPLEFGGDPGAKLINYGHFQIPSTAVFDIPSLREDHEHVEGVGTFINRGTFLSSENTEKIEMNWCFINEHITDILGTDTSFSSGCGSIYNVSLSTSLHFGDDFGFTPTSSFVGANCSVSFENFPQIDIFGYFCLVNCGISGQGSFSFYESTHICPEADIWNDGTDFGVCGFESKYLSKLVLINGAIRSCNATLYIVENLDWIHGHFSGGGNTVNLDKGVIESNNPKSIMTNTIVTNAGILKLKEGNVMGEAGSVFHNNGSGYMSICGDAGFLTSNSSVFINDGIINKTCSNAFDMNWSIIQSSTGRIYIIEGEFALTGTDNELDGYIYLGPNGVLPITSTTEFKGNGEFVVDKGEIRIEPGAELILNNFLVNVTKGSHLQITSGTVRFLNGTTVEPIDLIISDGIAVFEDVKCPLILPSC
ncbi:hypothetical protein GEMRC1_008828 [Eukaryota sp. GEM-RC1]